MKRPGVTKESVIDIAVKIADEKGMGGLTLSELADDLSIKIPSLYNHVKGMNDIYNELALRGLVLLEQQMLLAAAGHCGDEAVHSISKSYIQFAYKHPGLYEATQRATQFDTHELRQHSDRIVEIVGKVLAYYKLNDDKQIHTIRTLRSLLHGFASLEKSGFANNVSIESSIEFGIDLFLSGIKSNS